MSDYVAFLLVGRLLIWTIQVMELPKRIWTRSSFLTELVECDFCLGFWIYLFLSVALGYNGFDDVLPSPLWLAYLLQTFVSTFVMYVFVAGWRSKFTTTVIE